MLGSRGGAQSAPPDYDSGQSGDQGPSPSRSSARKAETVEDFDDDIPF
jgi:hypothetical protein